MKMDERKKSEGERGEGVCLNLLFFFVAQTFWLLRRVKERDLTGVAGLTPPPNNSNSGN